MRLLFDPEAESPDEAGTEAEGDAFETTCDMLVRLVAEHHADRQEAPTGRAPAPGGPLGSTVDAFLLGNMLEYRHLSTVDGRLALWREEHVRAVLLEWLPRRVTVPLDEAAEHDAPGALTALVAFLADTGVLDPRSDDPHRLASLAQELRADHEAAMQDPHFMGPAKFWMLTAARDGVDIHDERALDRFLSDARAGRVAYDEKQLAQIMENQFFGAALNTGAGPGGRSLLQERALPLPVVDLGDTAALRRAAAGSDLLEQLAEVARWVGAEGRPVTGTGRLKVADALALAGHLGTDRGLGEAAGPLTHLAGDSRERVRRADQLPFLRLLVDWARQARLVRVYRGRLVAVAGARAVREDPLALATRALTALPELRDPLLTGPVWDVPSDLYPRFDLLLTDILATLYGMPFAMPWPLLCAQVHEGHLADDGWFATPEAREAADERSTAELRAVLELLAAAGMVTFERGTPDAVFAEHLRDLDGTAARGDTELLRLTPLGTYAVRSLLMSLGRSAPAIGDLRDAEGPALLATLLDEYDPAHARTELAGWIEARGGWDPARTMLTDALGRVRLHSRRHALLRLLAEELPDGRGPELLSALTGDNELRPSALLVAQEQAANEADGAPEEVAQALARAGDELDDREIALTAAESLLLMREVGGEEALLQHTGHHRGDADAFATMLDVALASGHPDQTSLQRLGRIDIAALHREAASRGRLRAVAARRHKGGGSSTGKRKKRKRRH
ncbi:hypothetical protein [Streptomyces sp. NPDC055400]